MYIYEATILPLSNTTRCSHEVSVWTS